MKNNKIFILLPDGVGLRNFAFTNFYENTGSQGFDVSFWNNTPFDLSEMGFKEHKITHSKSHALTDLFKRARNQIDLNQNIKRSGDKVYERYRFPLSYKGLKTALKSIFVRGLISVFDSEKGIAALRKHITSLERKTPYYSNCLETLRKENPAIVFCTNQRPLTAIAPIVAAQDLGIPTATFIFSWDNLPKAMMVIETDYYFVWSDHMKRELLYYYPYITDQQVFVTGTPQFEPHFDASLLVSRSDFFKTHGLDIETKYICFSGDDITTSPNDPQYLSDTAAAIRKLNEKGHKLGIVFRRCPVDFSDRYNAILESNKDIIASIAPAWEKMGTNWNAILPLKEDMPLQINTIAHTEFVINLGSSMVFDYVSFGKSCIYVNYEVLGSNFPKWTIEKIYRYVHFRSMPEKTAVVWVNDPSEFEAKIENLLQHDDQHVDAAADWFKVINQHPVNLASERIIASIKTIINT